MTDAQWLRGIADSGWNNDEWPPDVKAMLRRVADQLDELDRIKAAIRGHHDQRGDNRCWLDDEKLYRALVAECRRHAAELRSLRALSARVEGENILMCEELEEACAITNRLLKETHQSKAELAVAKAKKGGP